MKYLVLLLSLLAVPSFAADLSGAAASRGVIVLGTLAGANDPGVMAVTPEYTRLAVVRQRTAQRLRALVGSDADPDAIRASIFAATRVQQLADEARGRLDGLARAKSDDPKFRQSLEEARETISRAETLYDSQLKGK